MPAPRFRRAARGGPARLHPGRRPPRGCSSAHAADPGAVMAWGDVHVWGDVDTRLAPGRQLDPWQIAYLNTLPVASMVRRSALLSVGGWQLRHGYEDWDLWMAFAERGWPGVYVPTTVLRYRRRGGRMLESCIPRHGELDRKSTRL